MRLGLGRVRWTWADPTRLSYPFYKSPEVEFTPSLRLFFNPAARAEKRQIWSANLVGGDGRRRRDEVSEMKKAANCFGRGGILSVGDADDGGRCGAID